jgi:hypothetical protein
MSENPAQPRRSWILWSFALIVACGSLYPLSFGPACWIVTRTDAPSTEPFYFKAFCWVYRPLVELLLRQPDSFDQPVMWYLGLGTPEENQPRLLSYTPTFGGRGRVLFWYRRGYSYTMLSKVL